MTSTLLPPQAFEKKTTFGEPKLQTDGEVLFVTFGQEGWLYSLEDRGILRKWNPVSGQQIEWYTLSDLETLWTSSKDGRVFASASDDLAIWDTSSGRMLTSIAQPCWVTALAFHPDPNFLATGHDDGSLYFWDAPGHYSVFESGLLLHKRAISAVAVSPDGKFLAAASEDKTISIWDLAVGKHLGTLTGHTDRIPALAWHPNSRWLVSVGWDTTARIWDVTTLLPVILLNSHATQVTAVAFSQDGKWLASADSSETIHLWDFASKTTLHKLTGPQGEIRSLAFSSDDQYLASNGERIIHLWNPATGVAYANLAPRAVAKTTVSVLRDGSRLATNGGGTAVKLWHTVSHQLLATVETSEPIHALAFSPDGKWIAAAVENQIRLLDGEGKFISDWDGPEETITALAFSPDSKTLASGSNEGVSVWLWRVVDGEPILLIPDALQECTIEALAFLPDNQTLAVGGIDWMATGGSNGAVSLWNLKDRCEVTSFFDGATALACHPSGNLLATASLDHSICVWDLQTQELERELIGHEGAITCLAFSPDGAWLASGSDDYTLRLWDARGEQRALLEMESQLTALFFSADGRYLYTGHANTTCAQIQLPELLWRK